MARLVLNQALDFTLDHHGGELDRRRGFDERPDCLIPILFPSLRLQPLAAIVPQAVGPGIKRREALAYFATKFIVAGWPPLPLHLLPGNRTPSAFAGHGLLTFRHSD